VFRFIRIVLRRIVDVIIVLRGVCIVPVVVAADDGMTTNVAQNNQSMQAVNAKCNSDI
jgi:hypothetical protein